MERVYHWVAAATYAAVVFIWAAMSVGAQALDEAADEARRLAALENWQIILAFILPLILQQITSRLYKREHQALAAFAVSFVIVLVGMFISGELQQGGVNLVTTPLSVIVASIAFFKGFWRPLGATPPTGEAAVTP
jgi:ABC-type transport system involved in cytochrome c biogenesis permease subunit